MYSPTDRSIDTHSKNVGVWIRVSTEDQARGESPQHHEHRARAYAESKGWHVCEVYDLAGVSGKSVMDHPETQRMLKDAKSGRISGLIFSKLARLARNTKELLEFADIFRENGCDLISLGESIDTSTPAGRLFYTMIAAMASWEREEIGARVAASVPIRAKLGKNLGPIPFGYRLENKKIAIHPVEGPVRRQIYELFAQHRRKKTVAKILNDAGHRTRDNVEFTRLFIQRVIEDPISKGLRRSNYTRLVKGKVVNKPQNEWVTVQVPALVSEELWNECNAILADQRCAKRPASKRRVTLFGGTTFCACGEKMYVRYNQPKYVCEKCRNKIPEADLEKVVHEQLREFSVSGEDVAKYLLEADESVKHKEQVLGSLKADRERVQQNMDRVYDLYLAHQITVEGFDRVYDLYLAHQITVEGFGSRYKPLESQFKQLEEEIPRLQAELDYFKMARLNREDILTDAKNLYDRWPTLTLDAKRQIAETLVERITVDKNEVTVELCYLPPTPSKERQNGVVTQEF